MAGRLIDGQMIPNVFSRHHDHLGFSRPSNIYSQPAVIVKKVWLSCRFHGFPANICTRLEQLLSVPEWVTNGLLPRQLVFHFRSLLISADTFVVAVERETFQLKPL